MPGGPSITTPCSDLLGAPRPSEQGVPRHGGKDGICGSYDAWTGGTEVMENQEMKGDLSIKGVPAENPELLGLVKQDKLCPDPVTFGDMVMCKSQGKHKKNPQNPNNQTPQTPKP